MTDQCNHCELKGDITNCRAIDCFQHENWYAKQQQALIEEQRITIIDMRASLRTCFNSSKGALDQYKD